MFFSDLRIVKSELKHPEVFEQCNKDQQLNKKQMMFPGDTHIRDIQKCVCIHKNIDQIN